MFRSVATNLIDAVDEAARDLRAIDDEVAGAKLNADVWSVKEILGHLVDSAANNHQRFVRAQGTAELSFPGYEQDAWVRAQDYQNTAWPQLVDLWVLYNYHLAHVIGGIPAHAADVPIRIGGDDAIALSSLAEDYVAHLRHHLRQIRQRQMVISQNPDCAIRDPL
jgi:DinB family protein